jgi:hypothetical protein
MKTKNYLFLLIIIGLILGTICGACGSKDPIVRPDGVVQDSNLPDWTSKTSWYDKDKKIFYAVGLYQGSNNPRTQRDQSALAARVEMVKFFQSKVSYLTKYYSSTTAAEAGAGARVSDEQFNQEVNKAFGEMTLSGVAIEETYPDHFQKVMYARAAMSMDEFKNLLGEMKTLSEGTKEAIRERADKAFQELDKEKEKNQ